MPYLMSHVKGTDVILPLTYRF